MQCNNQYSCADIHNRYVHWVGRRRPSTFANLAIPPSPFSCSFWFDYFQRILSSSLGRKAPKSTGFLLKRNVYPRSRGLFSVKGDDSPVGRHPTKKFIEIQQNHRNLKKSQQNHLSPLENTYYIIKHVQTVSNVRHF